ncbi:MAG: hypothetical protein GX043_12530 [Desulfovibrionales bacterium]|nr:hypothetical protein [Desulfovibrionales bacterium]
MTKFKKGQSGNPAGRPPGSGMGAKVRQAINARTDELIQAILDRAIAGDMQAAQLLLDRICPKLKSESLIPALNIPANTKKSDLTMVLLAKVLDGSVSIDQTKEILGLVATRDNALRNENPFGFDFELQEIELPAIDVD